MKLQVGNQVFDFFNNLKVTLKYASVGSTFSFSGLFKPENRDNRGLFKPLTYPIVKILDQDNKRLITGRVTSNGFQDSSVKALSQINGYSLPGVLEDCPIPPTLYPLQHDGKSLKEITESIIQPFGLNLVISRSVQDLANEVYPKTTADEKQTIKSYLDELASQKNIVISHTDGGSLLFTKARTNVGPIATFLGGIPEVKMLLTVDGRRMHNEITVQKQVDLDDDNAGEETINNPFVSIFRPTIKTQNSGNDIDTALAARNALSSELRAIVLNIEVDRWTWNADGKVTMKPNNIILVHNHHIHLYQFTRFFVESIVFTGSPDSEKATLTCVIPEVYNGETPKNIFTIPLFLHD